MSIWNYIFLNFFQVSFQKSSSENGIGSLCIMCKYTQYMYVHNYTVQYTCIYSSCEYSFSLGTKFAYFQETFILTVIHVLVSILLFRCK